jgi:hypothetical protein
VVLGLVLILLAGTVFAQAVQNVSFRGIEPKTLEFEIHNNSDEEQPLDVSFQGPRGLAVKVFNAIDVMDPNEVISLKVKLTPSEYLIGNSYVGTLKIAIGEEETKLQTRLNFLTAREDANAPSEDINSVGGATDGTGLVAAGSLGIETAANVLLIAIGLVLAVILVIRIKRIKEDKEAVK